MKFLSRLIARLRPAPIACDAQDALNAASKRLDTALNNDKKVSAITEELRYHSRVNHFAQRIELSILGER